MAEKAPMTQEQLRAYYQDKAAWWDATLTLDGLRSCGLVDQETLDDMAAEVQRMAIDLEARENDVIATLALITDPISRVGARLRYLKGLQWKEVADVMNCTASAIEQQVRRAMCGVIPGGRNPKCK